ncbi:glycosyltransferase family 2 protein [Gluconacetobacter diazotrophicus]|nr:glycosyltransferase family 2 protein [Gluconacetobacter diazotrophicus]
MNHEICAVVVTYNSDIAVFRDVMAALHEQVGRIVVVDNHSRNAAEIGGVVRKGPHEFLELSENMGLAHAQNVGISHGIGQGAKYILLMDQDTILPEGSVNHLHDICVKLEHEGVWVGAVANAYRDTQDGQINAIWRGDGRRVVRQHVDPEKEKLVEVDFLIASGSLIPARILQKIGLMDESLFIDLVDVEWGLRAMARGYRSFISFEKIMSHSLGNGRINVLGRVISLHSPFRNYYMVRNSIILARRKYIPVSWRIYFLRRVIPFFVIFGFFADRKMSRIRFMVRGAMDGVLNRGGRSPLN